jgi:hypothetical protein
MSVMLVGLAVGLLAGAGGGIVFGLSHATAPPPVAAVGGPGTPAGGSNPAGAGPTATPTGTPTPTASPESNIPPLARSALTQAVATNDRLATAKAGLKAALAAPTFDASSVAQILRGVSADSLYGEQLAGYVATWSAAGDAATTLSTFYGTTHDLAANGLLASVRNASAYRSAARAMIKQLDGLPALDAAMRSAAQSAGFELPAASG